MIPIPAVFAEIQGIDGIELSNFDFTDRGIKTVRSLKKNDLIITIPHALLLTEDAAYGDPVLGPILHQLIPPLSVDDTLAIFLLYIKSRENGYEQRRAHVNLFPTTYNASLFFSENELELCLGSSLNYLTKLLKVQINDDYSRLCTRLISKHQNIFILEKFGLNDYKWALFTIWSRGMDMGNKRYLAPIADMFNHSTEVQSCHFYDLNSNNLKIFAGKNYNAGDQVFINYGKIPNNRLARIYGFVIPNNLYDSYDLVLSMNFAAPYFDQKVDLLKSIGFQPNETFTLTLKNPLPSEVLRHLRIQHLPYSEINIDLAKTNNIISTSNEAEILKALEESIVTLLSEFKLPFDILELNLQNGLYKEGENFWMAAHVSVGEQQILSMSLQKVRGLLNTFMQ